MEEELDWRRETLALRGEVASLRGQLDRAYRSANEERLAWARDIELASKEVSVRIDVQGLDEVKAEIKSLSEDLAAYKDYYGTSITQVKHLQECVVCSGVQEDFAPCPNYPSE